MPKLPKISPELLRLYRTELAKNASPATAKRKSISLKKFLDWAKSKGMVEAGIKDFGSVQNAPALKINQKFAGKPLVNPKFGHWYRRYQNIPGVTYLNIAVLVILTSALGFGIYNQFFKNATSPLAFPTSLVSPNRYLSFQGRLTSNLGNPITGATTMVFQLYNVSSGGSSLWTGTCSITPDSDGVFSTLLGSTCGGVLTSDVFSQNAGIWLGVTVDGDAEATPRVQIATVAYALNSETLQGYPASSAATINTVPVVNNSGQIVLALSSPKILSNSGTFAIEGQAITIDTPSGSNGSINISPDGTGSANFIFNGASPGNGNGMINATDANLTSGSLFYGSVASNATGYNLLQLQSGSTLKNKFVVDYGGNATLSGTLSLAPLVQGQAGTCNAAAAGKEYYDGIAQAYYYCNGSAWTQIVSGSAGTNFWQLTTNSLAPANTTYALNVGNTASSSAYFHAPGTNNNDAWFNLGTGNLGIGTTSPGATLDINSPSSTTYGERITANSLTTGTGLYLSSTSTGLTSGGLASFDWSPGSAVTTTGDLVSINIGANGTAANLFNVKDTGSSLFSVSETTVTSNLPTSFTSPGDVAVAYDLNFTNPTASYIKSAAPLYIQAGESFNSSDLTLRTFNSGDVVIDSPGGVVLAQAQPWTLASATTSALIIQNGLMNFDTTNSRVGIGTTTPTATLDVAGAASVSGSLTFRAGTGTIQTTTASSLVLGGNTTGNITLSPSNDVAGGFMAPNVTNVTDLGTSTKLFRNIYGTTLYQGANTVCDSSNNCSFALGTNYWKLTTNSLSPTNSTYAFNIGNTASSSAYFHVPGTNNNDAWFNLGTGGVGIGTTAPAIGGLEVAKDAGGVAITRSVASSNANLYFNTGASGWRWSIGQRTNDEGLSFYDERAAAPHSVMYLQATSGNVGIGNISPASKLDVLGTVGLSPFNVASSSGTSLLNVAATGNVGIGTTAPTNLLDVNGTSIFRDSVTVQKGNNISLAVDGNVNGAYSGIKINSNTSPWYIATQNNIFGGGLNFNIGGYTNTPLMLLDRSGNLGIGTTSPTALLDVNGNASASGTLAFHAGTGTIQTTTQSSLVLGGNTTGNITLNPSNAVAGGFVAPNTTNVSDLGTSSLLWRNIYGTTVYQGTHQVCDNSNNCSFALGTNYWQLNSLVLSPANTTYDLSIGGTATSAAFHVFGIPTSAGDIEKITSSVIAGGNLFEATSSALTTGDILHLANSGTTAFSGNAINVNINNFGGGAFTGNFLNFTRNGTAFANTVYSVDNAGNSSQSGNISLANGARTIQTLATSGLTIGGSTTGNITLDPLNHVAGGFVAPNTNNVSDLGTSALKWRNVYATTFNQNGNSVCDSSNNCSFALGTNYWQLTTNSLAPANTTYALNVGNTASSSAYFHVPGTNNNDAWFNLGTGNVGIGKTNPASKLDVLGTVGLSPFNVASSSGTSLLNVAATGNVGIGTTSPATLLHVNGNGQFGVIATTDNYTLASYDGAKSGTGYPLLLSSNDASNKMQLTIVRNTNANYSIQSVEQSVGYRDIVLQPNGGNIGIGTTSPGYKLSIQNTSGQSLPLIAQNSDFVQGSTGSGFYFNFGATSGNTYTSIVPFTTGNTAYGNLVIPGGNVGIGTTNPTSMLSVGASSQFQVNSTGNIVKLNNVTTSFPASQGVTGSLLTNSDGAGTLTWASPTGTGISGYWTRTGTNLYNTNQGDNVGIGTTNPATALDVGNKIHIDTSNAFGKISLARPDGSFQMSIQAADDAGTGNVLRLVNTSGNNAAIDIGSTMKFYVNDQNTERMRIDSSGNVGIGTTAPLATLSVAGYYGGNAAAIINQTLAGDIFTASASGATKLIISNGGNLSALGVGQFGGITPTTYSRFGTTATTHSLSAAQDVLIGGSEELNGILYLNGKDIANPNGTNAVIFCTNATDTNCATPSANEYVLTGGSWIVDNSLNVGEAALAVNQEKGGDLFTASQSGIPVFTIAHIAGLAAAANGVTLTGAATGSGPTLAATGSDTNIPLSIDAKGTGALNLNNNGTGDILIGGGSATTGCTITNSTGALSCAGNITTAATGTPTVGFWTRNTTSGYLYPSTLTDNVGIGTTGPLSQLSIGGAGFASSSIYVANSAATGFGLYAYSTGTNSIGVSGVGTSVGLSGFATGTGGTGVEGQSYGTSSTSRGVWGTNGSTTVGNTGSGVYGDAMTGIGGYFTSDSGYALITGTGNVGIGTTNPYSKLQVVTGIGKSSITTTDFAPGTTGTSLYQSLGTATGNTYGIIQLAITGDTVGGNLALNPYGGNVGIGATNPGYQLTLGSTGAAFGVENSASFVAKNSSGTYETWMWPRYSDNIMYTNFAASGWNIRNNSNTSVMFMQNGGNVGIGTTNPGSLVDVQQSSDTSTGGLGITNSAISRRLELWVDANLISRIDAGAAGTGVVSINNGGGKVGIGTTNPRVPLEVSGFVSFTIGSSGGAAGNNLWTTNQSGAKNTTIIASNSIVGANVFTTSDERLKEDVSSLNPAMVDAFFNTVNPVMFTWISDQSADSGFIAQDLLKKGFGYLVSGVPDASMAQETNADGITSPAGMHYIVNYTSIIPILAAGIQKNNREIATMSGQIANLSLTNTGDLNIAQDNNGNYQVTKTSTGSVITQIAALGQLVVANIQAGAITTTDFVTQNINAGIVDSQLLIADSISATQATINNLTINNQLFAPLLSTKLISPIPGGTDVTVQIGTATESGKFAIQNSSGNEVASIDSSGNARLQGDLSARQATFSGVVHSQNIDSIQELLNQVATDQNVLLAATAGANLSATGSADLASLITSDLYVTNQAAINSLSVSKTVTIGSDMVFDSEPQMINGNWQMENTLNTLSAPLKIQSLAMAPVEIMNGLVKIDTHGNVTIGGDLAVAGRIHSSGLTLKDNPTLDSTDASPSALLSLKDLNGTQVSSVDASGSANFNSISASQFVVAGATTATDSAIVNGTMTTNATAGSANIPAGVSEITIQNPKVTDYTLVYVTPTSSTQNNVLYVKSKQVGQFVVGFTTAINTDVNFNWWVVQVQN